MPKIGIYSITNVTNGKQYVGSSKSIQERWNGHIGLLNKNKHHAVPLQREWNEYGEASFKFDVIEECMPEFLAEREQYYIDNLKSEYNSPNANVRSRLGSEPTQYLTFRVPEEMLEEFKVKCHENYKTMSSVIRDRIIAFVKDP